MAYLDVLTSRNLHAKRQEMETANLIKLKLRICYSINYEVFYLSKQTLSLPKIKGSGPLKITRSNP